MKCPHRPDSAWEAGAQGCRRACHKGSRADFPSFWRSQFLDTSPCGRRRDRRLPEWDPGPSRTARSSPTRTASTRGDQTRVSSRRQSLSPLRPLATDARIIKAVDAVPRRLAALLIGHCGGGRGSRKTIVLLPRGSGGRGRLLLVGFPFSILFLCTRSKQLLLPLLFLLPLPLLPPLLVPLLPPLLVPGSISRPRPKGSISRPLGARLGAARTLRRGRVVGTVVVLAVVAGVLRHYCSTSQMGRSSTKGTLLRTGVRSTISTGVYASMRPADVRVLKGGTYDMRLTSWPHFGGEPTSTIADWRFGERSDIDEISREEAKRFAGSVNLGQLVK